MLTGVADVQSQQLNHLPDGTYFDLRYKMLCLDSKISKTDWTWYKNYLTTVRGFSEKSDNHHALAMLDIGYIPIVYMPAIDSMGTSLFEYAHILNMALDKLHVPYMTRTPISFMYTKASFVAMDSWVNKLDVADLLGKPPALVTCSDVVDLLVAQ